MKGSLPEQDLDDYLRVWMDRNYGRRLEPFFQGTITSVKSSTDTKRGGYLCQIKRIGDNAIDNNTYLCSIPGYIPQVGDLVECLWRDQYTGYVLWELAPPQPLGVAHVINVPNQARLLGRTTSAGSPTAGTWQVGDISIDSNGQEWVCTLAGTPGTWISHALDSGVVHIAGIETVTGAKTFSADTTFGARLLFTTAVSKIIPGATSISHRNNADNADNLLITDAGAVTVRNGLTVTAGGLTVSAGGASITGDTTLSARLLFSTAAAKIIPGATSISHRNNADNADNLIITDAGVVTIRGDTTLNARLLFSTAVSKLVPGATSFSHRNNADSADNLLISDAGLVTVRNGFTVAAGSVTFSALGTGIIHSSSVGLLSSSLIVDADVTSVGASKLTGTTLPSSIVTSSLTTVGILASPHMTSPTVDSGVLNARGGVDSDTTTDVQLGGTANGKISTKYKARGYLNGVQNTAAGSNFTKVLIDTKTYDLNTNLDVATNHRYTAPIAGYYHVSGTVSGNGAGAILAMIYKNGTEYSRGVYFTSGTAGRASHVTDVVFLAATDFVELYVFTDTATTLGTGTALTYLTVHLSSV